MRRSHPCDVDEQLTKKRKIEEIQSELDEATLTSEELILNLPNDIYKIELFPYLGMPALSCLARTSTRLSHFFKQPLYEHQLIKLFQVVEAADYVTAKKIIEAQPSLMFDYTNFTFPNGHVEYLSPLKLAFKLYDTYMWRLCLEQIQYHPDYLERFKTQAHEQTAHVNLKLVFAYYDMHEKQRDRWLDGPGGSPDQVENAWLGLGKSLRLFLPKHMLREFCRKGDAWDVASAFNDINPPDRCEAFSFSLERDIQVFPFADNAGLGVDYSLVRYGIDGRYKQAQAVGAEHAGWAGCDAEIFRRLLEVRAEQFNAMKLSLGLPLAQSVKLLSL